MRAQPDGSGGQRGRALAAVHLAVLLFGLAGLFGKLVSLPTMLIVFGRTAWASVALGLLLAVRGRLRLPHPSDRIWLPVSGILLALHWYTFFESIRVSSVAVGLVSFSSFPLFVTFLEPIFFRESLQRRDLGLAILVVAGLLLVVPSYSFTDRVTLGACWGVGSGASFAVLALMNRRFSRQNGALCVALVQNAVAAGVLAPFAWGGGMFVHGTDLLYLCLLGVVCTALAHALFIAGLSKIRAQTASLLAGLEPVYGIAFAFVLLGERPALRTLLGGGIILFGVVLASLKKERSR